MKKLILSTIGLIFSLFMLAQAPQMFNYQAVLRNTDGQIIKDQNVSLKIEIVAMSNESVVYTEIHSLTSNAFGLIQTHIGTGETNENFAEIDWSIDNYKVQVSFDAEGNNNFTYLGENQLLSVPYALFATSGGDKQQISINGNVISLSDGGTITLPNDLVEDADADATNEIQQLTIEGDTIYLSGGGSIILPKSNFSGSFNDLNDIPANLDLDATDDFDGNYNSLANLPNWQDSIAEALPDLSGYDTNAADDFSGNYNDLTNLPAWQDSIAASIPDLTGYDANAADDFTGMYNDLTNLPAWNDSIDKYIATVDTSTTNEIQDLELVGSTLRITNNPDATDINLAPFTGTNTDEQTLTLGGTTLAISNGNFVDLSTLQDGVDDADADPTNEIELPTQTGNTGKFLTTNGTSPSWSAISSFSGSFNDLTDVPANLDIDATDDFNGQYSNLTGAPTNVSAFVNDANYLDAVEVIQGRDVSTNAPANGQVLKWNNTLSVWEPADDALGAAGTSDGVVNSASVTGTLSKTITLSRTESLGNITATFTDMVDDADADPTNEIELPSGGTNGQVLKTDGSGNYAWVNQTTDTDTDTQLSDADITALGYIKSADDADADPTNEIELPSGGTNGQVLKTDGLGNYTWVNQTTDTDTQLSDADITALGYIKDADDADADPTNEIELPSGGTNGQVLKTDGLGNYTWVNQTTDTDTQLSDADITALGYIKSADDADADPTNEIELPSGGTNGQVLKTDGSGNYTWIDQSSGTDDQKIDYIALYQNKLQLSLEGDNESVKELDLSSFLDNTDNQTIDKITMSGNSLLLSLSGDLELDKYVDLSQFMDNTDNQTIDDFRLSGSHLYLSLEDDGEATKFIDLSSLDTDDQTLTEILTANTSAGNKKITSLATPTANYDAATKKYVDDQLSGYSSTNITSAGGVSNISAYDSYISFEVASASKMYIADERINTSFTNNNLYFGNNAGANTTTASATYNTSFGDYTLDAVTNGDYNTALGGLAGSSISTGSNNTTIGYKSGYSGNGTYNTFVGTQAGEGLSGTENVVVGYWAARASSGGTGQGNTFLGSWSGYYGLGNYNLFAGYKAGYKNNADYNVFLGYQAGYNNDAAGNVFIGKNAGYYETGSNKLYISNQMGSSEANGRTSALVYGDFSAQTLDLNGTVKINQAYTLPTADGTNGEVLSTDGGGNLSWADTKTHITNLSDPDPVNDERSYTASVANPLSTTAQNMIKGGYTDLQQAFGKLGGSETIVEVETSAWVEFTNYDNAGDIKIYMYVGGVMADWGTRYITIPASKIDDASDLIRVQFKGYWDSLSAGTKYVKYMIKCNGGSDDDAVITINKVGYDSSVIAKEYPASSYSQY